MRLQLEAMRAETERLSRREAEMLAEVSRLRAQLGFERNVRAQSILATRSVITPAEMERYRERWGRLERQNLLRRQAMENAEAQAAESGASSAIQQVDANTLQGQRQRSEAHQQAQESDISRQQRRREPGNLPRAHPPAATPLISNRLPVRARSNEQDSPVQFWNRTAQSVSRPVEGLQEQRPRRSRWDIERQVEAGRGLPMLWEENAPMGQTSVRERRELARLEAINRALEFLYRAPFHHVRQRVRDLREQLHEIGSSRVTESYRARLYMTWIRDIYALVEEYEFNTSRPRCPVVGPQFTEARGAFEDVWDGYVMQMDTWLSIFKCLSAVPLPHGVPAACPPLDEFGTSADLFFCLQVNEKMVSGL